MIVPESGVTSNPEGLKIGPTGGPEQSREQPLEDEKNPWGRENTGLEGWTNRGGGIVHTCKDRGSE